MQLEKEEAAMAAVNSRKEEERKKNGGSDSFRDQMELEAFCLFISLEAIAICIIIHSKRNT